MAVVVAVLELRVQMQLTQIQEKAAVVGQDYHIVLQEQQHIMQAAAVAVDILLRLQMAAMVVLVVVVVELDLMVAVLVDLLVEQMVQQEMVQEEMLSILPEVEVVVQVAVLEETVVPAS